MLDNYVGFPDGSVQLKNSITIPVDNIDTDQIKNGAITTGKINNGAVSHDKLADNSVETNNIKNGEVTHDKLSDNSVETNNIKDSAVTTCKINDGAVTNDKMANNSVDTNNVKNGAITAGKLAEGVIPTNTYVTISQGSGNEGKILKVNSSGNLELAQDEGGLKSYKVVDTLPVSDIDTDTGYLTKSTRPTINYGDYCSNKVLYPDGNLPPFNSYLYADSEVCAIVYNSNDEYFYLITSRPRYIYGAPYHGNWNFRITGTNFCFYNNWNDTTNTWAIYRCNPTISSEWVSYSTGERQPAYSDLIIFPVSSTNKFKFVWVNKNVPFTSNGTTYTVTNTSNNDTSYIYANFFDATTGNYLGDLDNVDDSEIYNYNINVYNGTSWNIIGQFDLQKVLEDFAKKTTVNTALADKVDTAAIKQTTGTSTTDLMSQNAITDALSALDTRIQALEEA